MPIPTSDEECVFNYRNIGLTPCYVYLIYIMTSERLDDLCQTVHVLPGFLPTTSAVRVGLEQSVRCVCVLRPDNKFRTK